MQLYVTVLPIPKMLPVLEAPAGIPGSAQLFSAAVAKKDQRRVVKLLPMMIYPKPKYVAVQDLQSRLQMGVEPLHFPFGKHTRLDEPFLVYPE